MAGPRNLDELYAMGPDWEPEEDAAGPGYALLIKQFTQGAEDTSTDVAFQFTNKPAPKNLDVVFTVCSFKKHPRLVLAVAMLNLRGYKTGIFANQEDAEDVGEVMKALEAERAENVDPAIRPFLDDDSNYVLRLKREIVGQKVKVALSHWSPEWCDATYHIAPNMPECREFCTAVLTTDEKPEDIAARLKEKYKTPERPDSPEIWAGP
nr:Unknown Function [uncultured bacterium]